MSLYDELKWRGLVYDATEGVQDVLAREKVIGYIGFDPTAASLHVGSLLMMMALAHLQRQGHSPIALVGGGTGLIGDPSGKTAERQLLTLERVEENVQGIRAQLERFLDFDVATNPARLVNNADWLTKLGAIEFMRDVGKHFTVNAMLAKESVKRRTESEDGISYTEFSYSLLQAYDYLVLHDRCRVHAADGRQRSVGQHHRGYGFDSARARRKSARSGAAARHDCVRNEVRQDRGWHYLARSRADQAVRVLSVLAQRRRSRRDPLLKFFTFLEESRVVELEAATAREPESRHAQRELAREVTRLVHGEGAVIDAERAAEKLFKGDLTSMSEDELLAGVQHCALVSDELSGRRLAGHRVSGLECGDRSPRARRCVSSRVAGFHINGQRVIDERARVAAGGRHARALFRRAQREKGQFPGA